jgi:hypothetical protein
MLFMQKARSVAKIQELMLIITQVYMLNDKSKGNGVKKN